MKLAIIGAGGFGREVYHSFKQNFTDVRFYAEDEYAGGMVKKLSSFDPTNEKAIIAIANPTQRQRIAESMPKETTFATLIHPSVIIMDSITILPGTIICANCVLTTNINIGKHVHLNLGTTVGHDCILNNYFTTAPAVNISGNVTTGKRVYIGTNSSIREKVDLTHDVTIGMGSVVLNDIKERGTYVGLVK
jgi:sugar O-acyltransferase (sialic acid O-acetyltransferase NeuD family)